MRHWLVPWLLTFVLASVGVLATLQTVNVQQTQAQTSKNSLQFLEYGKPYIFERAVWCHTAWHAVALLREREKRGVAAYQNLFNELFMSFDEEGKSYCYSVNKQRAYARWPVARVDGLYVYKMYLWSGEVIYSIGDLPVLDPKNERGA